MTVRAMTSAAAVCMTVWVGGLTVAAAGVALDQRTAWMYGSLTAGLASFGGAYLLGRAHEAARHERTPR